MSVLLIFSGCKSKQEDQPKDDSVSVQFLKVESNEVSNSISLGRNLEASTNIQQGFMVFVKPKNFPKY
ncbi:hypothetical protein [Formosa sp. PL04]|uniref:hypothetical protein n=1 Tax=Formosa sp. PL04 TaxID=3081755 RepID=UPI0029829B45|nr:hypothetical protein [Formosa sp. PL04]MDW5289858.1 hypothetical protein [Formosa sp. PL04]